MTLREVVKLATMSGQPFARTGRVLRVHKGADKKKPFLLVDIYNQAAAFWQDDVLADDWELVSE